MKETFGEYLQRLKKRRTEDDYKYTDEDFEKYKDYIENCYQTDLSVYKCLEFMWFREQETLLQIDQNNPITRGSTALVKQEIHPEQIWNDEKREKIKEFIKEYKDGKSK